MHQAAHDFPGNEPLPASKLRTSPPLHDVTTSTDTSQDDGISKQHRDIDQHYIMLDDGIFVRINEVSGSAGNVQLQASPIHHPSMKASKCPDSPLDTTPETSPRLLIVPQYNMAANSVSCAFSVGGRSFLMSPTCVDSENSLLSFLDGNLNLSSDSDGDLMLWCSWFVFYFVILLCDKSFSVFEYYSENLCIRCMHCAPQIKDVTSSVGFGRVARRCSNCHRCTVQVHFASFFLPNCVSFPLRYLQLSSQCVMNKLSDCRGAARRDAQTGWGNRVGWSDLRCLLCRSIVESWNASTPKPSVGWCSWCFKRCDQVSITSASGAPDSCSCLY
jgi:hypothetical protein